MNHNQDRIKILEKYFIVSIISNNLEVSEDNLLERYKKE